MFRKLFTQKLGLPILDFSKKAKTRDYLNIYLNSLKWSQDKLEDFQVKKILALLKHSYNSVPFYRKRFDDAGFNYENFKYLDHLNKIPPLSRLDIQNNLKDLLAKNYNLSECKKGSSSGSTGTPVIYYHDMDDFSSAKAGIIFCKMLGGYNLGDKWINIWGNPTAVNVEWKTISSRMSKYVFNEIRYPAYRLSSEGEFSKLMEVTLKSKPEFVYGYTNAIYLFAEYLKNNGIKIDFVKGVFTTAENLQGYQRDSIENQIGRVFDQYGSSEINAVACETISGNYYDVIAPRVFVEFGEIADRLTDARKLIITSFENKVMPFIRYENGDLAVPETSKQKTNFPKIKSIEGRTSDIIFLPSGGSLVVPSFFGSRMLKDVSGIVQYQVIKKSDELIQINLITNEEFKVESKSIILNTLNEYIPAELKYELIFNDPIVHSKNNKFKLFVDLTKNDSVKV
jgi:phenylacetate-coenzyme A ligase PaaK-like adenylate-forming protein